MFNQVIDKVEILRIGIYGNTRAGKTSYIHKLIRYWQNNNLIKNLSNEAYDFMRSVDDQIKNTDKVAPTKGITDNITVEVLQDIKSSIKTKYIFSDLLGEMLSEQVDTTEINDKPISQILQCNGYLFFFNPTGVDHNINLDNHFLAEKDRALKLISHIRQHRENEYLPIVFVVTHLDKLKTNADLMKKTTEWLNEIADGYSNDLEKHYKQVKSISDEAFKQTNFKTMISSLSEENIDLPVRNIKKMVQKIKYPKSFVFLTFISLFCILFGTAIIGTSFISPGCVVDPENLNDAKVLEKLKLFEELLVNLSDKNKLTKDKLEVVEKINREITNWMIPKINAANSGLNSKTIEEINKNIENSQNAIIKLIDVTPNKKDKFDILGLYILNFWNYNDLKEYEKKLVDLYWKIYEEYIAEEGASIVNRYRGKGSVVSKCREELGDYFKKIENEFSRSKITGGHEKKMVGDRLKITSQYLLTNPQYYYCKLQISSASLKDPDPPKEVSLRVKYIDSKEYSIGLNKNPDLINVLNTKDKQYDIQFQMIPEPPTIDVEFFDESTNNWGKYETLNLVTLEDVRKTPLGPLGIALPFKGKDWECAIDKSEKKIKVEAILFLDIKNIPDFILKIGEMENGLIK